MPPGHHPDPLSGGRRRPRPPGGGFEGGESGGNFRPRPDFDNDFENMNLANFFGDRHEEILGGSSSDPQPAKVSQRRREFFSHGQMSEQHFSYRK